MIHCQQCHVIEFRDGATSREASDRDVKGFVIITTLRFVLCQVMTNGKALAGFGLKIFKIFPQTFSFELGE